MKVYKKNAKVANSKASVLISGETGTGKELCADAIHQQSQRQNKPLMILNCAAIPQELLESELFGYVKGAFTGANQDKLGIASVADGGTLFLDEIGEMDINLQSKLLRFVETGTFYKIGSRKLDGIIPRIGTAVYVRHGDLKAQLSVQSATYKDKRIVLLTKNTGKATARPHINWVLNKSGQEIASDTSSKQTVIAEGQRNLKIGDKIPEIESLQAGKYQISGELTWGKGDKNSLAFKQEFVVR